MNYSNKTGSTSNDSSYFNNNQNPRNHLPIVNSISGFLQNINKILESEPTNESKFLFRGQEDMNWRVETSAYRRLKGASDYKAVTEEEELYYNIKLIEQYKLENFHSGYSSETMKLDLGILAQLQYMGAATSLIEFSDNALVALWFACQESPEANNDNNGKVFILSTIDKSNFEEIDSLEQIENYKVSIPDSLEETQVDGILNNSKFVYWKPEHLNNRIIAQQLCFLIGKRELPKMQKIIIAGYSKKNILQELSSAHGINEITLFPDLAGFAQANSPRSPYDQEVENKTQGFIYEKIISRLNKIIKNKPTDPLAYKNRGNAKYNLIDYKGAINDFSQAIKIDPNNAVFYANRGLAKYKLKKYQQAVDDFTKSIEIGQNNAVVYAARALAKYSLNDHESSYTDFTKAIKINPKNALFYNNRSRIKHDLKDYQSTINDLTEAIKIEPNDSLFYANRGLAKYKFKKYQQAISDYNKAITLEANNAVFYANRGLAKYELENYKDAINDFTTSINISPKDIDAYNNRGNAKLELNDYKGAIDDFNQTIKIEPHNANAYYGSGDAKLELNDYKGAINDYRTALKLSTDKDLTKRMKKAKKTLKELLSKSSKNKK